MSVLIGEARSRCVDQTAGRGLSLDRAVAFDTRTELWSASGARSERGRSLQDAQRHVVREKVAEEKEKTALYITLAVLSSTNI